MNGMLNSVPVLAIIQVLRQADRLLVGPPIKEKNLWRQPPRPSS
jgi:hypothetical protein